MQTLREMLQIEHPIIMAPMFLVSNERMTIEALKSGITAAIPALNYRTIDELRAAIRTIKNETDKPFGINLIVNKSNVYLEKQLACCIEERVAFFITSLGSPAKVIEQAHAIGSKVFCDVTDVTYAKKVASLGADALIAVCSEAGGHAGNQSFKSLIPSLKEITSLPIIAAGGIGDYVSYQDRMKMGVAGVSIGTVFIASVESPVSEAYKQACVDYSEKDIVLTTKLSGTPCTVIQTPYVKQIGTKQSFLERFFQKNKQLKKWIKMLTFLKGMKSLRKSAFSNQYQSIWCAGSSIRFVHEIKPIKEIVASIVKSA